MKLLLKVYGILKMAIAVYGFYFDARRFYFFLTHISEKDYKDIIGSSAGAVFILIFLFYLFNSGLTDFKNKQISMPILHWMGIGFEIFIAIILLFDSSLTFKIGGTVFFLHASFEAFRKLSNKAGEG